MSKMRKVNIEKDYYVFKLEQMLVDNDISINKLMRDTNTDFKVIKRLMNGEMARIDITVLARMCDYLLQIFLNMLDNISIYFILYFLTY